jgi:hypothetical protein
MLSIHLPFYAYPAANETSATYLKYSTSEPPNFLNYTASSSKAQACELPPYPKSSAVFATVQELTSALLVTQ